MSPPTPEPSGNESGSESDDQYSSSSEGPRYTPQELGAIFLDLYQFLATLHFDPAHLKVPPAGGWPHITPEFCADFKSDYVLDVIRHLPYFAHHENQVAAFHYNSHLIDYSAWTEQDFAKGDEAAGQYDLYNDDGDVVKPENLLGFAMGRESFGRYMWLIGTEGCVIEEAVRAWDLQQGNVKDYFERLKQEYRELKLVPCLGKVTIEANHVPEAKEDLVITKDQVYAQPEPWGTHLDVQYLRQLYRQHGWPQAFQEEDARRAVGELFESMPEAREDWRQDLYW
ncbi:hypothetical protein HIM_10733 [Hirsutella minnesotensis 3608]|uniref:Uncharacterized protein n=1 Tax=Hirsutella minnesotensis 3608 TaxID=1043627 RepID=A0A0F7ZRM6_9HYPO|nr:hypothetical protein HIM_10733 [Hirsutella minnesotensis 3608]